MSDIRIIQSKRKFRRQLAGYPIGEKLRMLDQLRERALTIQRARAPVKKSGHSASAS